MPPGALSLSAMSSNSWMRPRTSGTMPGVKPPMIGETCQSEPHERRAQPRCCKPPGGSRGRLSGLCAFCAHDAPRQSAPGGSAVADWTELIVGGTGISDSAHAHRRQGPSWAGNKVSRAGTKYSLFGRHSSALRSSGGATIAYVLCHARKVAPKPGHCKIHKGTDFRH